MNYCSNCAAPLQAGAPFCAQCGTPVATPSRATGNARQQLAQAGLEVQNFNALLVVGRLVGLLIAGLLVWFVVGPALEKEPFMLLVAIIVLALIGILGGQWVTLLLLRR